MENLQPNPHTEASPSWVSTKLGKLVAGAVLTAEITPINEVMRTAVFVAAQARFDDPLPVAVVHGISTLAIELPAGLVAADIASTNGAKNMTLRIKNKISKSGLEGSIATNRMAETGVGMIGGSAVQMFLKHAQSPEMTKRENRKYAVTSSLGIAALCGCQGYLISAGISNPSVETVGGAAIAVGSIFMVASWARNKLKKGDNVSADLIERNV